MASLTDDAYGSLEGDEASFGWVVRFFLVVLPPLAEVATLAGVATPTEAGEKTPPRADTEVFAVDCRLLVSFLAWEVTAFASSFKKLFVDCGISD